MFVVTILSFVLIYGENGVVGEILSPALGGIIGIIKYVIPSSIIKIDINMKNFKRFIYIIFPKVFLTVM